MRMNLIKILSSPVQVGCLEGQTQHKKVGCELPESDGLGKKEVVQGMHGPNEEYRR